MKRILLSLTALAIAATLTACTKTENNSEDNGIVSNPFSESSLSEKRIE